MPPLRLLLADDHNLFRRGLASLLNETGEFVVAGEATSGPEAVRLAAELQPDVVLLDVHMPGGGGVEAVARLQEILPAAPVIMLTVSENDEDLFGAIRAGARGYFLKNAETETLYGALRRVAAGQSVLDPALTDKIFRHVAHSSPLGAEATPLTLREAEILGHIADGSTNREISRRLGISENTIKTHVGRILEKLGTSSRSAAVALARTRGWLPPRGG